MSPIPLIVDGIDLHNACVVELQPGATDEDKASFLMVYSGCINFLTAVLLTETQGKTRQMAPFCPPDDQSVEAVRAAVIDWMNGRADWHLTRASSVVHVAVSERFPCPR